MENCHLVFDLFGVGFLGLRTVGVLGWITSLWASVLCVSGCEWHPGLYALDAPHCSPRFPPLPLVITLRNVSDLAKCPLGSEITPH